MKQQQWEEVDWFFVLGEWAGFSCLVNRPITPTSWPSKIHWSLGRNNKRCISFDNTEAKIDIFPHRLINQPDEASIRSLLRQKVVKWCEFWGSKGLNREPSLGSNWATRCSGRTVQRKIGTSEFHQCVSCWRSDKSATNRVEWLRTMTKSQVSDITVWICIQRIGWTCCKRLSASSLLLGCSRSYKFVNQMLISMRPQAILSQWQNESRGLLSGLGEYYRRRRSAWTNKRGFLRKEDLWNTSTFYDHSKRKPGWGGGYNAGFREREFRLERRILRKRRREDVKRLFFLTQVYSCKFLSSFQALFPTIQLGWQSRPAYTWCWPTSLLLSLVSVGEDSM